MACITDAVALDCAQEAAGQLRFEIEAAFSQGLPNTPMANATVRVVSGNSSRPARSASWTAWTSSTRPGAPWTLPPSSAPSTPAPSCCCRPSASPTGEAFNLTMEDVATSTAIALQADKLVFVCESAGVPEDPNDPESAVDTELALADAERMLANSPPYPSPGRRCSTCRALRPRLPAGVERSHIIPFSVDGALLQEVYTHDGIGTMVVDEKLESLREATSDDVGGIIALIDPFERDGTMVKRDRNEIERDIQAYTVIEHDGVIFGCAALFPYVEAHTAEMAALTVSAEVQGQGDGDRLLKRIEQRAKSMGLESIFVLTTRTMHWFIKRGFQTVDPEWRLPEERKRKYKLGPPLASPCEAPDLIGRATLPAKLLLKGIHHEPHRPMRLPQEGSAGP